MSYSMQEPEWEPVCECRYDEVHDRMDREDCFFHCDMEEEVASQEPDRAQEAGRGRQAQRQKRRMIMIKMPVAKIASDAANAIERWFKTTRSLPASPSKHRLAR